MSEVKLILRTADQVRKAEIAVPREMRAADVVQTAIENWQLPRETDYTVVNVTQGKALVLDQPLSDTVAREGDVLEIQPVLVAG